ncbi:MAG: hypothetical protein ACOCWW_00695 [Bacteroidota bacterium]
MGQINLYQNTARFYDGGINRKRREDIDFYKDLLKLGIEILDVDCGTKKVMS